MDGSFHCLPPRSFGQNLRVEPRQGHFRGSRLIADAVEQAFATRVVVNVDVAFSAFHECEDAYFVLHDSPRRRSKALPRIGAGPTWE